MRASSEMIHSGKRIPAAQANPSAQMTATVGASRLARCQRCRMPAGFTWNFTKCGLASELEWRSEESAKDELSCRVGNTWGSGIVSILDWVGSRRFLVSGPEGLAHALYNFSRRSGTHHVMPRAVTAKVTFNF